MKNECIDCACVMKSSSTLKNCQLEMLENNHAVVKFRKGDSIIKQGVFSTPHVLPTGLCRATALVL